MPIQIGGPQTLLGMVPGHTAVGRAVGSFNQWEPRQGETEEEWAQRIGPDGMQWFRSLTPGQQGELRGRFAADPRAADMKASRDREAQVRAALDQFSREMMTPLSEADMQRPEIRAVMQQATGAAQQHARMAGVQGGAGMSTANTENAYMAARVGLDHQRKQMGMSALGMQFNDIHQVNQLRQNAAQFDAGMSMQARQARHEQEGGMWRAGGAALGGIAGGMVGGAEGAKAGSSIGAGMGGAGFSGLSPAPSYTPSGMSRYGY
jgi:hypothetical protein